MGKKKNDKEKNQPLLKLIRIVLNTNSEWEHGDTSRFARIFSRHVRREVSRVTVGSWLYNKGVPPKYLLAAVQLSNGQMTFKELRPDLDALDITAG